MVTGAMALAEYANEVAKRYDVNIALHTDHCPKDKLDGYVRPLIAVSAERVKAGGQPIFQSHMWDGSAVPLTENLKIAEELLDAAPRRPTSSSRSRSASSVARRTVSRQTSTRSSTRPPRTLWRPSMRSALASSGRYMVAADVRQRARRLQAGQRQAAPGDPQGVPGRGRRQVRRRGGHKPFDLVFHGGSGSLPEEIADAVDYGVVKMNVDTDTQYAFTRPVADQMLRNYDGVLKVDGEVGNKKQYDPRAWGKEAEAAMAARVVEACTDLRSAGTHVG